MLLRSFRNDLFVSLTDGCTARAHLPTRPPPTPPSQRDDGDRVAMRAVRRCRGAEGGEGSNHVAAPARWKHVRLFDAEGAPARRGREQEEGAGAQADDQSPLQHPRPRRLRVRPRRDARDGRRRSPRIDSLRLRGNDAGQVQDRPAEGARAAHGPRASVVCMYRYILRESCSQFDSLPLTYLTISGARALPQPVPRRQRVRRDARARDALPVRR